MKDKSKMLSKKALKNPRKPLSACRYGKIKMAFSSLTCGEWRSCEGSDKTALDVLGITDDNFPVPSRWHTQTTWWEGLE